MGTQEKVAECLICGDKIKYMEQSQEVICSSCGEKFKSNAVCERGHFVCDKCHGKTAIDTIIEVCLETKETDAVVIAQELMEVKWVHMHGPEHHYLVAAALLTAYGNAGYGDKNWNLKKALKEAKVRAIVIPGGVCGFWGCCGAAVSSGIFAGIIAKVSPLSKAERGNANLLTSRALELISKDGGPRCCKRDSFTSILTAIDFVRKTWNLELGSQRQIHCTFFPK